jgi:two-component system OmpR family sensor kinase/two-component system sensor histidine kinase QseC
MTLWITASVERRERQAFVNFTAERLARGFEEDLKEDADTLTAAQGAIEDGVDVGVQVEVRHPRRGVLASSLSPAAGARSGRDSSESRQEVYVASATNHLGIHITVAQVDQSRRARLATLATSLVIAGVPIVVLSLLLGRWIVVRALRPLSVMADRAVGLSAERKPRSLGSRSGLAEVDRLADSFDRLLERLDDAMSAERRLTADASHELRTPLTVLGGELEMLVEKTPPESPEAPGLRRAAEQVGAMRELVEAILLLHRSGEAGSGRNGGFEVLNLCDLAREMLAESLSHHAGRESDVKLAAPDEILLAGHAALLGSALRNLLDNALKFTRPGDRVEIRVAEAGSYAELTVDDQGPGVRDDERERIFDPFYRGAEASAGKGGFGLGLPILRRVARAHGGDVEVTRSELGGARFVMRLPRL